MIGVASAGLLLALAIGVMRGEPLVIGGLGLALFTSPLWGSIGLAFLTPAVTRLPFLASCLVILPASGYCLVLSARVGGPLGGEWLALGLGLLWIIVPFGFGDVLSKDFHAWRTRNRLNGGALKGASLPSLVLKTAIVDLTDFVAMRGELGEKGTSRAADPLRACERIGSQISNSRS